MQPDRCFSLSSLLTLCSEDAGLFTRSNSYRVAHEFWSKVELSASTEVVTPRNRIPSLGKSQVDKTLPEAHLSTLSNTITVQEAPHTEQTQRRGRVRKSKSVRMAATEELQVSAILNLFK